MKLCYSSTKNIYQSSSPYINNDKNGEIDKNSPIKVRRKKSALNQVNSLETSKNYKSNKKAKSIVKYKPVKINYNIFILNNLIKYNSYPNYYYIKISNQLLFNFSNRLVSHFKDHLIWNEKYDYFKNYNDLKKSRELLPKIGHYYETYTLFVPNSFPLRDLNNIISKYIKNRMKYLEMTENEEENKDEIKDIDKKIIENNSVIGGDKKDNNDNKKKEITINQSNNENNNNKLINSTEIKTENSCSISNYFGIDSVIKCNAGENYNFENQLVNFSLLNKIRNKMNNKKEDDKVNLDFSLELASIIQSFEEKEKNYYKNLLTPKTCSLKNVNASSKGKKIFGINKYNTRTNYYNKNRYQNNQKIKKNLNILMKRTRQVNNSISKEKENNKVVLLPIKSNTINDNIYLKENVYKSFMKNKFKNKSRDFYRKHYLTFITDDTSYNLIHKFNDKNIYNTYIPQKNYKNNIYSLFHRKSKKPISNNERNIDNGLEKNSKTLNTIKISTKIINNNIKYSQEKKNKSISTDNKNVSKGKMRNKDNLILNNKIKPNEENENFNTSPSLSAKRNRIISRNLNSNDSGSLSQRNYMKSDFSSSNSKKMIYVNKKQLNKSQKFLKQKITVNSLYRENNTLNNNKTSNKIIVNKNETLRKGIKTDKKINHSKNLTNLNIIDYNSLGIKNYNNCKSFVETEFNAFIPKMIIKKMFLNRLNNEKKMNKKSNQYSSMKKHNISKNQNTYSSINSNNPKVVKNYNKLSEIKIPSICSVNKIIYKNKRVLTEFNKVKNISKRKIQFRVKDNQNKEKQGSKISIFSPKDRPHIKNKKISFKNNSKFNKTISEINKVKIHNFKQSFVSRNSNYLINVNIFNNFKINPEIYDNSNKKEKKNPIVNHSLKSSFINKNSKYNLGKNSPIKKNNNKKNPFK